MGPHIRKQRGSPPPGCNDYYANTRYMTSVALWAIISKRREPLERQHSALGFRQWAETILKPSYG
eukprot:2657045-Karenia_brevis.AAC.1